MRKRFGRDNEGTNYRYMNDRLEAPMLFLSLVLIPLLLGPYLNDLSDSSLRGFSIAGTAVWFLFVVEFFYLLYLSPNRSQMIREHKLDALMVFVPMLRPLRLLRIATAGTAIGRAVVALRRIGSRPGVTPFLRLITLVILVGAGFTLGFEHGQADSTITNFGEALWWSFVTCTTVGYGDFSPVTTGGRVIAGILMVFGIAGLSLVTASVAALFVEEDEHSDVDSLKHQLDRIEASLVSRQ